MPSAVFWMPDRVVTSDLLIVDAVSLTRSERRLFQAFSRLPSRPPILLIDSDALEREDLALIQVEHVVREGDVAHLKRALQMLSRLAVIQSYGRLLADRFENTPTLRGALRLLFTAAPPLARVNTLAAALGVSERTLRAQWRNATSGAVRLSDLTRVLARARSEHGETLQAMDALRTLCTALGCAAPVIEDLGADTSDA